MKISKQARRDAKALLRACQVNGVLDENRVRQTVQHVIAKKPRGYLGILQRFQHLVKLDLERRRAQVEYAVEIPPALMESIKTNLTRRYGPGLNIGYSLNPDLIAGLRIKVGSDVFDGSLKARLADLESSF